MILAAAYIWMISNFIMMIVMVLILKTSKKDYHLMYVFFHLSCALWGMTVPAINVPFIHDLNAIAIPICGSFFGIIGVYLKLKEEVTLKD